MSQRHCFSLLLVFFMNAFVQAQDKEIWYGVLDVKVTDLRLVLELNRSGNEWKGSLFSLDQDNAELKLDTIQRDDKVLAVDIKKVLASFRGELDKDHGRATGMWKQAGNETKITFRRVESSPAVAPIETWTGILKAGERKLELQFRLFDDGRQQLVRFDSLNENITGLKASLSQDGKTVEVEVPVVRAKFKGKINDESTVWSGDWLQGGSSFPCG